MMISPKVGDYVYYDDDEDQSSLEISYQKK
jgi:hypothetical protein